MIKRVLIANRGAIAVRIIRTLKAMGIHSIAVYAEADRESLHVRFADEAFSLGEGNVSDTYLNQKKIMHICQQADVDAIHPGYGFLSENTGFVGLCESNNIIFLGPTAQQIEMFGLKHRARELAEQSDVPLLPGSAILADRNAALVHAKEIGYPVMLKSTAGGGGIGMQLCRNPEQLSQAWESVAQLSQKNFANADLFIEKFVEHARHIEVQVFGDGEGNCIAIGERDCSAQRRNQKVLEETPAPNISDDLRKALHKVAVRLMRAVNYRSAGTVEFIVDADTEDFYFLEVNTRLQVEHGVTEMVYGIDLVRWMIELPVGQLAPLSTLAESLSVNGHAIQARVYAENPAKNFQPSAGLLSAVSFPASSKYCRIDHWIEAGIEVSPLFDPMLAKVIVHTESRHQSLQSLQQTLADCEIYGIETNLDYLHELLANDLVHQGRCLTTTLSHFQASSFGFEVLAPGTLTTIQDFPGRTGYWDVGIPPSGPFDDHSFRLGNQLLGNDANAAGLEFTLNGAQLRFSCAADIVLCGATMSASIDDEAISFWQIQRIQAGQTLHLGKIEEAGLRSYLCVAGGIQCPEYLGSRATFTLGQFGGHGGRALRTGDVLHLNREPLVDTNGLATKAIAGEAQPQFSKRWELRVVPGPQAAPEYFSEDYINQFYASDWQVHFNSSRTGVRLIGPKPEWTRSDGGEAGMHPSNIHDNAYAIGAIDFTGDMPVILGPDGPSLGGFVCPATVISADLWKVGQLAAGDTVTFVPVTVTSAVAQIAEHTQSVNTFASPAIVTTSSPITSVSYQFTAGDLPVTLRQSGDSYLLIECGEAVLDIELRFFVHRLMLAVKAKQMEGVLELTPGIRSLQIHYDCQSLSWQLLVTELEQLAEQIAAEKNQPVDSRIIHLPLSWDDEQCQLAIEKYHQTVRKNAPWYPSNIEFIRRINGLDSVEAVKQIVFDANYLVMGLGDVYLGAPVATPIDPRHRLVTTKYNPARTWTAENSVGIGGSYLCIYGMEGPGGYQFVGRTLQMWNRYRQTDEFPQPWLLRFFDQIKFYPVSGEELLEIRKDFPLGKYPLTIENTQFDLQKYKHFLETNQNDIDAFTAQREQAFAEELDRWQQSGQFHFEAEVADQSLADDIDEDVLRVDSPVAGSVWQLQVKEGDAVKAGQCVALLESMKMEIEVTAPYAGVVEQIYKKPGSSVLAGAAIMTISQTEK